MTYIDLRQPSQDELLINLERRDKIHKPVHAFLCVVQQLIKY